MGLKTGGRVGRLWKGGGGGGGINARVMEEDCRLLPFPKWQVSQVTLGTSN